MYICIYYRERIILWNIYYINTYICIYLKKFIAHRNDGLYNKIENT